MMFVGIVFEQSACENSVEFPAESGCMQSQQSNSYTYKRKQYLKILANTVR